MIIQNRRIVCQNVTIENIGTVNENTIKISFKRNNEMTITHNIPILVVSIKTYYFECLVKINNLARNISNKIIIFKISNIRN